MDLKQEPADAQAQLPHTKSLLDVNNEENTQENDNTEIRKTPLDSQLQRKAIVLLHKVNSIQINGNNLNGAREKNYVAELAPHINGIGDRQQPTVNEPMVVNYSASAIEIDIKTEPNDLKASKLFNLQNRKTDRNFTFFQKTNNPQNNNSTLKVLCDGAYIEIDEAKCLKWMEGKVHQMVKTCAVPNSEFTELKRKRRSERIAQMEGINYKEPTVRTPTAKKRTKRM